jgi:hypothetical protein
MAGSRPIATMLQRKKAIVNGGTVPQDHVGYLGSGDQQESEKAQRLMAFVCDAACWLDHFPTLPEASRRSKSPYGVTPHTSKNTVSRSP